MGDDFVENITDNFISELLEVQISDRDIYQAKRCLIDYVGVTLAGSKMLREKGDSILDFLKSDSVEGAGKIVGYKHKSSLQNAVLLNGMNAHVAELDDGERFGMFHPGAPIISALIPLIEPEKVSGKDFLKGIILGYEAAIRLARTIQPSAKDKGYHATGICGTIGAAIGISTMLGFSHKQIKDALSASATSASGILRVIKGRSELKPYNSGQASLNGLIAVTLARAGFNGHDDVLSGEMGLISIVSDKYDLSELIGKFGSPLGIHNIYMKPYAACRHCHPAIEAALKIRSDNNLSCTDISNVKVTTYYWAVGGHEHTEILGVNSAKMSIPYSVSVALCSGKAGMDEFSLEKIDDTDVLSLTKKISVIDRQELTDLVPQKRAAIVDVITKDNQTFTARIDLPKGEPETALSDEELEDKFFSLAVFSGKTSEESEQIVQTIWNIDVEHNINTLYDII